MSWTSGIFGFMELIISKLSLLKDCKSTLLDGPFGPINLCLWRILSNSSSIPGYTSGDFVSINYVDPIPSSSIIPSTEDTSTPTYDYSALQAYNPLDPPTR